MSRSTQYYTLIGSLPTLPRHFEQAERVPISPFKLQQRLKMLEPADARVVTELSDFLVWERQSLEQTDQDVLDRYDQFQKTLPSLFLRKFIQQVIAMRAIIAGLRCRRLQQELPAGRINIQRHIASHWGQADFGLGPRFPWIGAMEALLSSDTPLAVERQKLEISWQYAQRLAGPYFFSFEAVLLYLIRLDIVDRWTRRNAARGQEKFDQLARHVLGPHATMFSAAAATTSREIP